MDSTVSCCFCVGIPYGVRIVHICYDQRMENDDVLLRTVIYENAHRFSRIVQRYKNLEGKFATMCSQCMKDNDWKYTMDSDRHR